VAASQDGARGRTGRCALAISTLADRLRRCTALARDAGVRDDGSAEPAPAAGAKRAAAAAGNGAGAGASGGKRRRSGDDGSGVLTIDDDDEEEAAAGGDDDDDVELVGGEHEDDDDGDFDAVDEADPAAAVERLTSRRHALEEEEGTVAANLGEVRAARDAAVASRGVFSHVRQVLTAREAVARLKKETAALAASIEAESSARALAAGMASGGSLDDAIAETTEALSQFRMLQARNAGQLEGARGAVDRVNTELRDPELKEADRKHTDALVRETHLKMLVEDLGALYAAVDAALQRYHRTKLAEINDIVKDLWTHTYSGNDIDNIEIRSDTEDGTGAVGSGAGAAADPAAKASRSYNYRVVMSKGDSELDMRGRCSAGQKVLASIVIRLALAESFGSSTGLLALDEPTTNLDAANRAGLARALARIIERRGAGSLQLVVITHDEEFVSELGRSLNDGGGSSSKAQLGTYYRVYREEVRPGVFHSRIDRQDM
jgi:DNA repair exonuclease SbcCD ATPase subunit